MLIASFTNWWKIRQSSNKTACHYFDQLNKIAEILPEFQADQQIKQKLKGFEVKMTKSQNNGFELEQFKVLE